MKHDDRLNSMGIVRHKHSLVWAPDRGHFRWLPFWARDLIVASWNWVSCRIFGHEAFLGSCVNCNKELLNDGTSQCDHVFDDDNGYVYCIRCGKKREGA